jgi:putative ABC transport system permease protein
MLSDLLYRFRALFQRSAVDGELDEELRIHFEHDAEKLMVRGLSREEAMRQARLAFGGLERVKEDCRQAWGVDWLQTSWQDLQCDFLAGNFFCRWMP